MDFLDLLQKDNEIYVGIEKCEVFITDLVSSKDLNIQACLRPPIQTRLGPPN
jgi:hypothetical protein